MFRFGFLFIFASWVVISPHSALPVSGAETDKFSMILEKMDNLLCSNPEAVNQYYSSKYVIMVDDKRALLENRVKSFRGMMSELVGMKCSMKRKVLAGKVGDQLGYLLVDELGSVVAENVHIDERNHSVCSYIFSKEKGDWKISLEHCSNLPDYTIQPGEDALYYFHNPVY